MDLPAPPVVAGGPALGQFQAIGLLAAYSVVYVLPLYASVATRPSPTRPRDAPQAIRARIRAVSLSTAACSLITLMLLLRLCPNTAVHGPAHLMGYWPLCLAEAAKAVLLTAILFAAPLFECLVIDGTWRHWLALQPLRHVWVDWPAWRNLVAGPLTEECLFRSAAVPLLLLAGSNLSSVIFLSPLVFGLAHLHHFYEFRITHPKTPLAVAIARSLLQLTYTSMFGAYATFIFLRTGSLLGVILVHTLCNTMGLPRVWGTVEPHWLPASVSSTSITTVKWTCLYYGLLIGGLVIWWRTLYFLTLSPMALIEF